MRDHEVCSLWLVSESSHTTYLKSSDSRGRRCSLRRVPPSCSHHHTGPKLTDEPITSWKTLKSSPVFRETPAAVAAAASSPRAGLSFWAAFPHARRVSAGVMRYLAERDGELLSQGESTAATPPRTDTLPPNAILPSSPLRYLTAARNKEGK